MIQPENTRAVSDLVQAFDADEAGDAFAVGVKVPSDFVGGGCWDEIVRELIN